MGCKFQDPTDCNLLLDELSKAKGMHVLFITFKIYHVTCLKFMLNLVFYWTKEIKLDLCEIVFIFYYLIFGMKLIHFLAATRNFKKNNQAGFEYLDVRIFRNFTEM